ncbi:MAG: UvrD-helicase domain-containing protein [Dysgonamonadaceae bacterium]|jgi:DNA helicase-2/ATP-dependent DNA helicase PcrA|nr:UvrD-helicase domain-containing protein [Dysgonamonadaceae bacterium]
MADFLNELNEVQRSAVTDVEGASLIIAGAGSGKTRVLTYRIAYLLSQGVAPDNILALTFTRKAAREMKERIAKLVGEEQVRRLWMGTFHSVFARILRYEAEAAGYPSNYTIYDTQDARNVIKQIVKEMKLDDNVYKAKDLYHCISAAKNNLITAESYFSNNILVQRDKDVRRPLTGYIYRVYAQRCLKAGAMDYDDILLNTTKLFRNHPEVLDKYQLRFHYILVDEYQDTNAAQYMIVRKLAQQRGNVCVVGDDAQSIYSFRGARIENILNFRKDYPDYKIFKLERNYRSTKTIVNAANTLIEKNRNRIDKRVFSENTRGEPINVFQPLSDQEEGYRVAASIVETQARLQLMYKDFAILSRTNAQSRIFEEALRKLDIPYTIFGGPSFYERKEVKDVLAYGKLLMNPRDDEAFRRIVNVPMRGIGAATIGRIEEASVANSLPLWEVAVRADELLPDLPTGTRTKLQRFVAFMNGFAGDLTELNAYELLHRVVTASGIITSLQAENTPENISRLQNIEELLNGIREFVEENGDDTGMVTLEQYLSDISLLTAVDQSGKATDSVAVMTIHSAKGLEFEVVYIVGLEENLFPSPMAIGSQQELEEERRLFYVALTRARRNVFLSYAGTRFRWGLLHPASPSRFLDEIDAQYLDFPDGRRVPVMPRQKKPVFMASSGRNSQQDADGQSRMVPVNRARTSSSDPAAAAGDADRIRPGMTVEHQRFGRGEVIAMEGKGASARVEIQFGEAGRKLLLLKFAQLKIV